MSKFTNVLKKLSFASKSAALACIVALSPAAYAMDFTLASGNGVLVLHMDGEINLGDEARMRAYASDHMVEPSDDRPFLIILNSNGGNVREALLLAEDLKGTTIVVKDTCASACFFIFAAAKVRAVTDGAHVGVHSIAVIPGHPEVNAGELTADMVKKLREMGVPDDICMDMLTTSNDSIHWLSKDQLTRMNAM